MWSMEVLKKIIGLPPPKTTQNQNLMRSIILGYRFHQLPVKEIFLKIQNHTIHYFLHTNIHLIFDYISICEMCLCIGLGHNPKDSLKCHNSKC